TSQRRLGLRPFFADISRGTDGAGGSAPISQRFPQAVRQHGDTGDPHPGGVADGGEDGGRGGDQRRLAYALGAEGAVRLGVLDQVGFDGRHVADGGDQVVVQVL